MAALGPLLAGAIAMIAASLVSRVIISLGMGVVSYIGMGVLLDYMFTQITESFNGLPLAILQMAALIKFDVAVNILMGAVNARLGFVSLNGIVSRFQIDPAAYNA